MFFPSSVIQEKVKACACKGLEWDEWLSRTVREVLLEAELSSPWTLGLCTRGRAISPVLQTQAPPKFPVSKRARGDGWNHCHPSAELLDLPVRWAGSVPVSVPPQQPATSTFQFCEEHSWFSLWQYVLVALDKADLLLPVAGTSLSCIWLMSAPWKCLEVVSPVRLSAPISDPFPLFSTLQDCGLCVRSFACYCSAFPNTELADWLFPEILIPKSLLTPVNLKQLLSFPLLC